MSTKQPIRFGRRTTLSTDGQRVSVTEQIIAHYGVVKNLTQVCETIPVDDEKSALSEFLKLLDRQKSGEVDMVGIQLIRNPDTRKLRAELSWFE